MVEYKILKRGSQGRGYQFLTLIKGSSMHDAELQPAKYFVNNDGKVTQVL